MRAQKSVPATGRPSALLKLGLTESSPALKRTQAVLGTAVSDFSRHHTLARVDRTTKVPSTAESQVDPPWHIVVPLPTSANRKGKQKCSYTVSEDATDQHELRRRRLIAVCQRPLFLRLRASDALRSEVLHARPAIVKITSGYPDDPYSASTKATFMCTWPDCGRAFAIPSRMREHYKRHPPRERLVCRMQGCPRSITGFTTSFSRMSHEWNRHPTLENGSFNCRHVNLNGERCTLKFVNYRLLRGHLRLVHDRRPEKRLLSTGECPAVLTLWAAYHWIIKSVAIRRDRSIAGRELWTPYRSMLRIFTGAQLYKGSFIFRLLV